MISGISGALIATCLVAAIATLGVRELALRTGWLDTPNSRSAHVKPTPRLGGIGIMVALLPAAAFLVSSHGENGTAVIVATAFISVVGLIDDLRPLAARLRFGAQCLAAALVVGVGWDSLGSAWALFGGLPAWLLAPISFLWIVWVTNLYNFMDGIDGLAGGQAVIAGTAIAIAAWGAGAALPGALAALAAAAALGFLVFNFPPASIFMGDVGSTALGFLFASLPFVGGSTSIPVEVIGMALALFILDATYTLIRRMRRGEKLSQAHRSHVYQRPLALGVRHLAITLISYCGMVLVGAGAVLFGHLGAPGRVLLLVAATALFAFLAILVASLEVSRSAATKVSRH